MGEWSVVRFLAAKEIFLLAKMSRLALEPTYPHIHQVPGCSSAGYSDQGMKLTSPPYSATVKNEWSCTSKAPTVKHIFSAL